MDHFREFNLNRYVKVKLTEAGYKRLADNHNSLIGTITNWPERNVEFYKSMADSEGYTKFQAHDFIAQFGGGLPRDYPDYFSLNILIEQ